MNACQKYQVLLEQSLDSLTGPVQKCEELDAQWPEWAKAHGESCAACRAVREEWLRMERDLRSAARNSPSEALSPRAHERILAAVRLEPASGLASPNLGAPAAIRRSLMSHRWMTLAAAAVILIACGIWLYRMELWAENPTVAGGRVMQTSNPSLPSPDATAWVESGMQTFPTWSDFIRPPSVLTSAGEDLTWLKTVVLAQPQSAARAFFGQQDEAVFPPSEIEPLVTPDA